MRIAFLLRIWPIYGGGETVTKCLANELVNRGNDVFIIYTKQSATQSNDIDNKIHQILLPNIDFDENSSEFFLQRQTKNKVCSQIKDIILKNNIEIIINQWWPVNFLKDIRENKNIKIIKCLHMDPNAHRVFTQTGFLGTMITLISPLYRLLEKKKHIYSLDKYINNSDLLVFLAPSFLEFYRREKNYNKEIIKKTAFVFNPLVYQRKQPEFNMKEKKVLFVGRLLEKHKQVSKILYAWKHIQEIKELSEWKLEIVGDGPDKFKYEQIIKKLQLRQITLVGYQQPLPYYHKASIFLMTSAYEGFPMTLIESLQNGVVPIVMDSFSSLHDIITNDENGIITPNNNMLMFINSISSLMQNENKLKRMAESAYSSSQKLDINTIVNKWEELFHSLL